MLHQSQVLHCELHVAAHLLIEVAAAAANGLYDGMSAVNWRRQAPNVGINPLIVLLVNQFILQLKQSSFFLYRGPLTLKQAP